MSTPSNNTQDLTDTSRYIRTFAKDMAALQGKGAPQPQVQKKPVAPPPPPPPVETTDGVSLPEVDESLITESKMRRDGEETLDLNDTPTSGPVSVLEEKQTPPPIQPNPVSLTPSREPSRDDILARLKARAAARAEAPVATPAPAVPEPKPVAPQPTPEPAVPEVPAPIPPKTESKPFTLPSFELPHMPQPPARPAPPPPPPPKPKPEPETPERFHSYTTDFSNRIGSERASAFSVLAAQSDTPREVIKSRYATKQGPKPSVILASVLVVLGIGVAAVGFAYYITRPEDVVITQGVPSLVAADETKELVGTTGTDFMRELRDTASEPLVQGNVLVTYITTSSTTPKGLPIATAQPGGFLIKALPLFAPDILLRNIAPESTVGVISAGTETRPFFILKVSSFERTFAGMLAWEGNMRSALGELYPAYANAPVTEEPVDLGTTTPSFVPSPTEFVDAVVRNYDVRILRDAGGRSLIIYGYKDKETLIIARDEAAFIELVNRLNASGK